MSWTDALAELARPVGLRHEAPPSPLDPVEGAWFEASWGVLWALEVPDAAGWPEQQELLAEALQTHEARLGLTAGVIEAWLVLVVPEVPDRRVRQAAHLDVRIARKHVVWPGEDGWVAALGAVTCLALPPAQLVRTTDAGDGWLAELAGADDKDRTVLMKDRLAAVEAGL
ncbi:MAG: hypothetical protein ACI8PZ_006668 [Myxococcota bacterium]|jgi:hypothetical protein